MVNLTINGQAISVKEGTTIMEAAQELGIEIPHLCFLKDINEIGACRVCVVENVGMEALLPACNTPVEEGMEILTNSPRAREARKNNVKLILSEHDYKCATCVRSGNCSLQTIANNLGIQEVPYKAKHEELRWNKELPLIRDASKCIKCMRCIQICDKVQGMHVWDVNGSGSRTTVGVSGNVTIDSTHCTYCGQCITHCPVGALHERNDVEKVFDAIEDPEKITLVQIAPAVRAGWGESAGLAREDMSIGKLVAALKQMGVDYVFDTVFTADLTIMEEGSEFLERLTHRDQYDWPMFTSCCPGWLRFIKKDYPEYVHQLSTAKSPQGMFGALAKTFMAQKLGVDPDKIFSISIMPCTAKKFECNVEEINDSGHGKDVDVVLTTREFERMVAADSIDVLKLQDAEFDQLFGEGTGAGVIFGATGGVMEAALRSAYFLVTGENPPVYDAFKDVRGMDGWKEATFEIQGIPVRTAVASGLGNTRRLMEAIDAGEVEYDFVEIMACPGGCAGGGGQPIHEGQECAEVRGGTLYDIDAASKIQYSHENPTVALTYEEFLEKPLGEKSHHLLHTNQEEWTI